MLPSYTAAKNYREIQKSLTATATWDLGCVDLGQLTAAMAECYKKPAMVAFRIGANIRVVDSRHTGEHQGLSPNTAYFRFQTRLTVKNWGFPRPNF